MPNNRKNKPKEPPKEHDRELMCGKCSFPVDDDYNYCPHCGIDLTGERV